MKYLLTCFRLGTWYPPNWSFLYCTYVEILMASCICVKRWCTYHSAFNHACTIVKRVTIYFLFFKYLKAARRCKIFTTGTSRLTWSQPCHTTDLRTQNILRILNIWFKNSTLLDFMSENVACNKKRLAPWSRFSASFKFQFWVFESYLRSWRCWWWPKSRWFFLSPVLQSPTSSSRGPHR